MTAAPIHLAGERLMLDPLGALIWPVIAVGHRRVASQFVVRDSHSAVEIVLHDPPSSLKRIVRAPSLIYALLRVKADLRPLQQP